MTANDALIDNSWDPDTVPEFDDETLAHVFKHGQISHNGVVVREATGTLTRVFGRPKSPDPKQLVSIRLDRIVLERLRASGAGWQTRVNEILRKAVDA